MTYKEKIKLLSKRNKISMRDASEQLKYDKYMRQTRTLDEFNSSVDELFKVISP